MRKTCKGCPALFEVMEEGLIPTGGGWRNVSIDNENVILCRPGTTIQKKKPMEINCYYCLATRKSRKIDNKETYTGRRPGWCPLRKGEQQC